MDFKNVPMGRKTNGGWLGDDYMPLADVSTVPVRMRYNVKTLGANHKHRSYLFSLRSGSPPESLNSDRGLLSPPITLVEGPINLP